MVTALTVAAEAAEKYAPNLTGTSQPDGHFPTPLLGILDEAANVCRTRTATTTPGASTS